MEELELGGSVAVAVGLVSCVICHVSNVICHVSCVTRYMTHHTLHMTFFSLQICSDFFGIGVTILTRQEIQYLPYKGLLLVLHTAP